MSRILSRHRTRRGVTVVEFALMAPIFFLLFLAAVEFGWAMMTQTILVNAARVGSRAAALDSAQVSDVTAAVNRYLNAAGIPDVTPTVSPNPPSSATAGQDVTVTVSLPFSRVSLLPSPQWLGNITLKATSTMRRETSY